MVFLRLYSTAMAHNNIEVEIKVPITKSKYDSIKKRLGKTAKLIKTSHHVDGYYTSRLNDFLKPKYPYEWLMLRKRDGVVKLSYKHWYPEGVKYTTHCDEFETVVDDHSQMEKILIALQYKKFVTVDKKRLTYVYRDELEIALDTVRGLGYFIEIESLKDFGGIENARKRILSLIKELGIRRTKTVPGGYAAELIRKSGK